MNRKQNIVASIFLTAVFGTGVGLCTMAHAEGQAPFPGAVNVNGGWVPCNHQIAIDAGLSCTGDPGYDYDPFPPKPARHVFSVNQVIRQPYPTFRAIVVSVGQDGTKTIVTARITRSSGVPAVGDYIAFDSANTRWYPLSIHELP